MNLTLTVLTYRHRHGDDVTLHRTADAARDTLAEAVAVGWREITCRAPDCLVPGCAGIPGDPGTLDRDEAIRVYFAHHPDETYDLTDCDVDTDPPAATADTVAELRGALATSVNAPGAPVAALRAACRVALRTLTGGDR